MKPTNRKRLYSTPALIARAGQTVYLTHPGGDTLTGVLKNVPLRVYLELPGGDQIRISHLMRAGYIVEVDADLERPTEPGLYLDDDGDLVAVFSQDHAVLITGDSGSTLRERQEIALDDANDRTAPFTYLPFTKIGDAK